MFRIGFGEDTHRLEEGRKLILGGVDIPFELGLLGHSDADVIIHAIIDALLGASALGDIGMLFPDTDRQYKDISSMVLLTRCADKLCEHGFKPINIDVTLIAQRPKLAAYREEMRANIAYALNIAPEYISIKFTTPEHTGPEGNMECMTARAAALIEN